MDEKPAETAERYCLDLPPAVDRRKVTMKDPSYVAGAFRFQLEFDDIMRLLMDKSLYPDPSLFLRELLQNALGACLRKEAQEKLAGRKDYKGINMYVWETVESVALRGLSVPGKLIKVGPNGVLRSY